jgi:hypothetical protein
VKLMGVENQKRGATAKAWAKERFNYFTSYF